MEAVAGIVGERSTVLVGHSGAGALLEGVGDVLDHARGYVFTDADLPTPGMSWLQTAPPELAAQLREMTQNGWLPRWAEWRGPKELAQLLPDTGLRARFVARCPRLPLAMLQEVLPPAPDRGRRAEGVPAPERRVSAQGDQARALGWGVVALAAHHLAMLTAPELVIDSLCDLVEQVRR